MAEHDPQRITPRHVAHGQLRVVGAHGAGTDQHRVVLGPEPVRVDPGFLTRDPAARPVRRGRPSVERGGELQGHHRSSRPPMGEVGRELFGGGGGRDPEIDLETGGAQAGDAPPVDVLVRILERDHDAAQAGGDDGVGAGRRASVMVARLEGHVQRAPARVRARRGGRVECDDLGVTPAGGLRRAVEGPPVGGHHDGTDPRIRRGRPPRRRGGRERLLHRAAVLGAFMA